MIIYINARFLSQPLSGVQRYAIECSLQIKKLYSEVVFLAPPAIILKEYAALLKPQIIGKNAGHLWEQTDLPQFLRKKNNPPLLNLANTAPLSYRNNYITIHDLSFLLYPQWNSRLFSTVYNYLVPRIAKRAKHIFTVSESIKHDIVKHYAIEPECVSITYNGIANAIATHSGDNSANAKKTMILAVGSVNPRKNQYNLIRAFIVSGHFHQYQLVIVGNKGKAFAKTEWDTDKLLSHNVHIKENVTDSQLIALYQEAQIHVSVSYYEGFGIPVLEGLFWGCKT
ncbi:MAG: glycosyltransferase family 1 protein, partial [Chitinophagia bacterium]|nr:glycosyltransferase family 1 protein [Chitinophagia bacterium]